MKPDFSVSELNSVLNRTQDLLQLLKKDADTALEEVRTEKEELKPYRRRVFIRSFFAFVEGHCFCHRSLLLKFGHEFKNKFSDAEILKLKELKEVVDSKTGETKQVQQWLKIEESLKISLEWTSKAFGFSFKMDKESDGYKAFLESKDIRNELMHPKRSANLLISDLQFQRIEKAFVWFLSEVKRANKDLYGQLASDTVQFSLKHI
jgi:hypothetical protein